MIYRNSPNEWTKWISWAEFCYNTSWHSTIKTAPFEVVYNRERRLLWDYLPSTIWVEAGGQELTQRDQNLRELREHIKHTQDCMTKVSRWEAQKA